MKSRKKDGKGEQVIVSVTNQGYLKRLPLNKYRAQSRGGKGVKGLRTRKDDFLARIFIASTKDLMLFFTDSGKVHWMEVSKVPTMGRSKPITKLLRLGNMEGITSALKISEFKEGYYLTIVTKEGMVKKTDLMEYSHPRQGGIIAVKLGEYDELVRVLLTTGKDEILVSASDGHTIKFSGEDVSPTGRGTMGVRAIKLRKGSEVVGATVVDQNATVLTVTEKGYGKRTSFDKYPLQSRGGQGVKDIKTTERSGPVVAARAVREDDGVMFTTSMGRVIRTAASGISETGRNVQGVRIMRLEGGSKLVSVAHIVSEKEQAEIDKGRARRPLKSVRKALIKEVEKGEVENHLLKRVREAVKEELEKKDIVGRQPEAKERVKEVEKAPEVKAIEEKADGVEKKLRKVNERLEELKKLEDKGEKAEEVMGAKLEENAKRVPEAKDSIDEIVGPAGKGPEIDVAFKGAKVGEIPKSARNKALETPEIPEEEVIGAGQEVLTSMDQLLEILEDRDKISMDDAAKELGVDRKHLESWTKMLEGASLIELHFSIIGGAIIKKGPNFEAVEEDLKSATDEGPNYYNFR